MPDTEEPIDVIIAGAGPIGLFLACELAMRDVSVVVLEHDTSPQNPWKSDPLGLRGLNTPSAEAFYRRGLLGKVCDVDAGGQPRGADRDGLLQGQKHGFKFGGHFAGIFLDATKMDMKRWPYLLPGPAMSPRPTSMERIEKVLTERAEDLDVTIIRSMGVTKVIDRNDGAVTVHAGNNDIQFVTKWVVGCDGGRSTVRKSMDFEFLGTEATFTGYVAMCEWESQHLRPGWHHTEKGMYMVRPPNMLYVVDFDGGAYDRSQEITPNQLEEVACRISGVDDVKIKKIHLASTFTDRCKQATTYRKRRVLLAGDAAHIHSPLGAQGLNLGIGDAMNLGWKLAATFHQEKKTGAADFSLLDTYTAERHPIGAGVLEWQRTQVAAITPSPWGRATQKLIRQLIETNDGANLFIDRFWGLSQKYDLGDPHPLVGGSVPDFEQDDGLRLGERMDHGIGLVIDFEGDEQLEAVVNEGPGVYYLTVSVKDQLGLRALYVRPDGVVAWVAEKDAEPDLKGLKAALEEWSV